MVDAPKVDVNSLFDVRPKWTVDEAAYNNVHQNITLISPLTAGLLNVIKVAPEVIETKCF